MIPAKHPNSFLYALEVADWLSLADVSTNLQTGCLLFGLRDARARGNQSATSSYIGQLLGRFAGVIGNQWKSLKKPWKTLENLRNPWKINISSFRGQRLDRRPQTASSWAPWNLHQYLWKLLVNLMFWRMSRNAKPDDDLETLMIGNPAMNENSIDWDAYWMHHKDIIHHNGCCYFNRCADFGKYTGTIS